MQSDRKEEHKVHKKLKIIGAIIFITIAAMFELSPNSEYEVIIGVNTAASSSSLRFVCIILLASKKRSSVLSIVQLP